MYLDALLNDAVSTQQLLSVEWCERKWPMAYFKLLSWHPSEIWTGYLLNTNQKYYYLFHLDWAVIIQAESWCVSNIKLSSDWSNYLL